MDSDTGATAEVLDLRGLKCPLPALLAKKALLRARAGSLLDVLADDPLAVVDIPHMCVQEGFEVVSTQRDGIVVCVRLRRPSAEGGASRTDPAGR